MKRLLALAGALLLAAAATAADRDRTAGFAHAVAALEAAGDVNGARAIETLREFEPLMPPELSTAAATEAGGDLEAYRRHRHHLALFYLADQPSRARGARHLHRAEAALHLLAIEFEKKTFADPRLVHRFLREAEWALRLAGRPPARPSPPARRSSASPSSRSRAPGETTTLRWSVANADRILLNGRAVPARGEETRRPTVSEYHHLTAERDGTTTDASLWILVAAEPRRTLPPPAASISATPSRILFGESITVAWNARGGETITLNGVPVAARDSRTLFPTTSGRFRLVVEAASGRAQASAQIYVFGPRPAPASKEGTGVTIIEAIPGRPEAPEVESLVILFAGRNPLGPIRELLEEAARRLRADDSLKIRLEGHADRTGREAFNRHLSLERAERIKHLLVREHGCDAARIETAGFGSDQPAASNETPEGRRLNRRVEIRFER